MSWLKEQATTILTYLRCPTKDNYIFLSLILSCLPFNNEGRTPKAKQLNLLVFKHNHWIVLCVFPISFVISQWMPFCSMPTVLQPVLQPFIQILECIEYNGLTRLRGHVIIKKKVSAHLPGLHCTDTKASLYSLARVKWNVCVCLSNKPHAPYFQTTSTTCTYPVFLSRVLSRLVFRYKLL